MPTCAGGTAFLFDEGPDRAQPGPLHGKAARSPNSSLIFDRLQVGIDGARHVAEVLEALRAEVACKRRLHVAGVLTEHAISERQSPLHVRHLSRLANDTGVQPRAREGAKRPTRPSACNA